MNNSQRYFSYPHESGHSAKCGHYNLAQIIAAQKSLLQQVSCGRLQWLCSTMRFNPFNDSGRVMTSNLWEGDEGMMEHIQQTFPMPLGTFLESSVKDPPNVVDSSNDHEQSSEDFIDNHSICTSLNFKESSIVSENSDTKRAESVSDNCSSRNNKTDNYAESRAQKLKFLEKITNLNLKLSRAHKKLEIENKRLSNCHPNVRKKVCRKLAYLHRQSVLSQTKLEQFQSELKIFGYNDPTKICHIRKKHRFKEQDNLSSNLNNALINCNNLRSRLRNILHNEAKLLLPFRIILKNAAKDLLVDRREYDKLT